MGTKLFSVLLIGHVMGLLRMCLTQFRKKLQMNYQGVTYDNDLILKIDDIIFEMTDVGYRRCFEHVSFAQDGNNNDDDDDDSE